MRRLPLVILLVCSYAFAAPGSFDGKWWKAASKDERTGFLAGYIDCSVYETGKVELKDASWNVLEPRVTKYYDAHPSELPKSVESVVLQTSSPGVTHKVDGGERFTEEHGIFDGEYWRQSSSAHRLGFVEGYLSCQRVESKPTGSFSKPAAWYADRISEWYAVRADDPAEINEKRVDRKIANALYLLKDKPPSKKEP